MKSISFIYLSAFSNNGGIEKFNRALLKAFDESNIPISAYSIYDYITDLNEAFCSRENFHGKLRNRLYTLFKFLFQILWISPNIIIIGHLNIAPFALILQRILPNTRFVLIGHGIDVWYNLTRPKISFLNSVSEIWVVSHYTKSRIVAGYPDLTDRIKIFSNTLDPYFPLLEPGIKKNDLLERYKIKPNEKVILTIARLSSLEAYKGYDRVLQAIEKLKRKDVRYILAGKYDEIEKNRMVNMASELSLSNNFTITGFINDDEIIDHYQLADVFIMPSSNEGFGIVFIEALACGTPVIAGNKDGSVDALRNGELGTLIDPFDIDAIAEAIKEHLEDSENKSEERQSERIRKVHEYFGYDVFKERLKTYLSEID